MNKAAVIKAISLKCSNCWGALSFANRLGGSLTPEWEIAHTHTLKELLDYAEANKIDLTGVLSSVQETPIQETMYYRLAAGIISKDEFTKEFRAWKG